MLEFKEFLNFAHLGFSNEALLEWHQRAASGQKVPSLITLKGYCSGQSSRNHDRQDLVKSKVSKGLVFDKEAELGQVSVWLGSAKVSLTCLTKL